MNDFLKLLHKPAKERRKLSDSDVQILADVDLASEWWTPNKTDKTLELMQIALKIAVKKQVSIKPEKA